MFYCLNGQRTLANPLSFYEKTLVYIRRYDYFEQWIWTFVLFQLDDARLSVLIFVLSNFKRLERPYLKTYTWAKTYPVLGQKIYKFFEIFKYILNVRFSRFGWKSVLVCLIAPLRLKSYIIRSFLKKNIVFKSNSSNT